MIHIVKQKVSDPGPLRACMDLTYSFLYRASDELTELLSKNTVSSVQEISVVIHNKMALASPARERKDSSFGRFLKSLTSDDPDNIVLTGIELKGLLHHAEETADAEVVPSINHHYSIRYEDVRKMHAVLVEKSNAQ